jgi:hypothetical protein
MRFLLAALITALGNLPQNHLRALSVAPPLERITPSANARYLLHVVPFVGGIYRQGFKPEIDGVPSIRGSLKLPCYGTLLRFEHGFYTPAWRKKLANQVAPGWVHVADDGQAIIAFSGLEDDEGLALYGPNGELIRKFLLADFYTAEEIAALPRNAEFIRWMGESRLDAKKNLFCHGSSDRAS